jgi:hypothetical protein
VSSIECHRDNKPFEGQWFNKTNLEKLRRKGLDNPFKYALEEYSADLGLPPVLEDKSRQEANQEILEHIEGDWRDRLKAHTECGFVGDKEILKTPWWERPEHPDKSPQPLCHTTRKKKHQEYREHVQWLTISFKKASQKLRAGRESTFPSGFHKCLKNNRTVHPPRGP